MCKGRRAILAAALAALIPLARAQAQRVPLAPGNRIRVATVDSATRGLWLTGRVLNVTRIGLLLAPPGAPADTVPVPLDPRVRLQVYHHSRSTAIIGSAVGLGVGAPLGLLLPASTFGQSWGDAGHVGEVIIGALLGAGLGLVAGVAFSPAHWEEVPLTSRGIAVAALERPVARSASFGRLERWTVFEPGEADFATFFAAYQNDLASIEGVWQRQNPGAPWEASRIAIVRDRRYQGYDYVAVWLSPGSSRVGTSSQDGLIVSALTHVDEAGRLQVRGTEAADPRQEAVLERGELHIREAGGTFQVWVKLAQTLR